MYCVTFFERIIGSLIRKAIKAILEGTEDKINMDLEIENMELKDLVLKTSPENSKSESLVENLELVSKDENVIVNVET